jgi:hypothetical protein
MGDERSQTCLVWMNTAWLNRVRHYGGPDDAALGRTHENDSRKLRYKGPINRRGRELLEDDAIYHSNQSPRHLGSESVCTFLSFASALVIALKCLGRITGSLRFA